MMDIATSRTGGERLYLWIVIFVGVIGSLVAGAMIASNAIVTVIVFFAVLSCLIWIFFAKDRWWVLMPMAGVVGGYFYFGHKIFTNEVAMLTCLIPLAMGVALRAPEIVQRRSLCLPFAVYILTAYLAIHWFASDTYNRAEGDPGYGNVARVYLTAVGVIMFVLLFKSYGSTRYVPLALFLTYLAAFFRVTVGLIIYFTNSFAYLPVVNYVLPGSTNSRSDDLRNSGLILLSISLCYFLFKKGPVQRTLHLLVITGSCTALALGAGRVNIVLGGAMLLFAAALYRKAVPLALCLVATVGVIIVVNSNPTILNPFEPRVQRAFSILLLDKHQAAYYGRALSSDQWHEDLRSLAYTKWTQSWNTFLFGTGVRPVGVQFLAFIPNYTSEEDVLQSASKVGAYESGWWTVLAVTGIVGLALYVSVLLFLFRRLFPILIKDKVRDHTHAFAFLAVFGIVNWIALGWSNGSFPSTEIMFGFLAVFASIDQKRLHQGREVIKAEDNVWHRSREPVPS